MPRAKIDELISRVKNIEFNLEKAETFDEYTMLTHRLNLAENSLEFHSLLSEIGAAGAHLHKSLILAGAPNINNSRAIYGGKKKCSDNITGEKWYFSFPDRT